MDPLSIAASVAGLLSLTIQIGQTVSTLADALEKVDNTISSFRGEIAALSGVLDSINTAFNDPKRYRIIEEASSHGTGHIGQYWKGVVVSLDHCEATLRKMSRVLDGVQTCRRTRIFRSFGKHLKLTSEEGVLTLYRQEVQSHTANLQISLQMISVCLSLSTDDMNADASVRLDELGDDVRNIYRLLERTKSDLPEPQLNDTVSVALVSSSHTVVEGLKSCLGVAELLISDASTLAEKQSLKAQSVRESAVAVSDHFSPAQRRRVQDWINAPTVDVLSEASSEHTQRSGFDVMSTTSTHATSPMMERYKPLPLAARLETVKDDDAISESSDIDSGFKNNLYHSGLQYFEKKDYIRAERFFTKAVQAGAGSNPEDGNMLKVKFYLAQSLSKQQRWDDALALLNAIQPIAPAEGPLQWLGPAVLHELALIHLGKGLAAKAKTQAKAAASKRKKLHGKTHTHFYSSIGLLADICDNLDEPEEAEAYRLFIPNSVSNRYTHIHKGVRDEKEVFQPTSEEEPPVTHDLALLSAEEEEGGVDCSPPTEQNDLVDSSSPPSSAAVSRSTTTMSRTTRSATTPATQYSDFFIPASAFPPHPPQRVFSDSYIPPLSNTFELESSEPVTPIQSDAKVQSEPVFLKEFLEVFRKVGQYQMLGWKDKASKIAIAYYRTFADMGRYKLISRYMDDIAWRCLERNITEGLSSLSSTGHGFSGVHFFALLGIPDILELLLERKADVSAKAGRIFGYTLANDERKRGGKLSGLARSLSRTSINSIGSLGIDWTPLHFAAAYSGDPGTIQLLIEKGAPLEDKAGKGYTPLLLATRKAALDMERYLDHSTDLYAIQTLVAGGAKVDATDDDGLGITAHANCMKSGELATYLFNVSALN